MLFARIGHRPAGARGARAGAKSGSVAVMASTAVEVNVEGVEPAVAMFFVDVRAAAEARCCRAAMRMFMVITSRLPWERPARSAMFAVLLRTK